MYIFPYTKCSGNSTIGIMPIKVFGTVVRCISDSRAGFWACSLTLSHLMQICLSFYEVKNKQPSWFSNKIEHLYWEQWYINLNVAQQRRVHSSNSHRSQEIVDLGGKAISQCQLNTGSLLFRICIDLLSCFASTANPPDNRSIRRTTLEASLRDVLFQIIRFVNDKKEHVPPIPNREGVISFPYEITIPRLDMWSL